jgi:hypothetical protein
MRAAVMGEPQSGHTQPAWSDPHLLRPPCSCRSHVAAGRKAKAQVNLSVPVHLEAACGCCGAMDIAIRSVALYCCYVAV